MRKALILSTLLFFVAELKFSLFYFKAFILKLRQYENSAGDHHPHHEI